MCHEMRPLWLVARFQLPTLPPSMERNGCEVDLFDRPRCEQSMLSCHMSISVSLPGLTAAEGCYSLRKAGLVDVAV